MKNMNNTTKMAIGGFVIAALFFYGGYAYAGGGAKGGAAGIRMMGANGTFTRGQFAGAGGAGRIPGGFSGGTILAKDAQSITVKAQDGSSRIIFWSPSTQVMKTVSGTGDDLVVGQNVMIAGTQNTDGSLTAQSIQIRPARAATTTPSTR